MSVYYQLQVDSTSGRYKVRLVARGYIQSYGIHYQETLPRWKK